MAAHGYGAIGAGAYPGYWDGTWLVWIVLIVVLAFAFWPHGYAGWF